MRKPMKQNHIIILLSCLLFLTPSCSSQNKTIAYPSPDVATSDPYDDKELNLDAIIVLPTQHTLTPTKFNQTEIAALNTGAQTLTNLMGEYFINTTKVSLLSPPQVDSYLGSYIGNQLKEARYIGMQAGADAVLISQIYRFQELDGKKYGANAPASVSFDYQLIHLESGMVLCRGTFDETQQPLLSNLLSFGKASKRKFKFVKGAALLQEGVEEKFSQCSHLKSVKP